jgi:hypothetical protein
MTEIVIRIEHNKTDEKLNISVIPRDNEPTLVEKDVFLGLMPLVHSLLAQILGQEGFKSPDKSDLVDKQGNALSDDYMVANGMVEPEGGAEVVDPRTGEKK